MLSGVYAGIIWGCNFFFGSVAETKGLDPTKDKNYWARQPGSADSTVLYRSIPLY